MKFYYDGEGDALAIELVDNGRSERSVALTPDVTADFDASGRLISIEVLDASAFYDRTQLERLDSPEAWLTLADAARDAGLAASSLRVLIHAGKFPRARKQGRDWTISTTDLANYLANRGPAGRPAKGKAARPRARR